MNSKSFVKTLDHIILPGIIALVLLPAMILPQAALSQENQAAEQSTLRQASQQWMQVGIKQYQSNQFADAERSFLRARVFQNYLTAAERRQLAELIKNTRMAISEGRQATTVTPPTNEAAEPNQPVTVEAVVEKLEQKIKESESPKEEKEEGAEKLEEVPKPGTEQPAEIETEPEVAVPAIETELTESDEFYTTIIARLEQELEVQSVQMADAEDTIQAQVQALNEMEGKLKVATQALTEAQQQVQTQAKQSGQAESEIRSRIEAQYAEAVSAAEAETQKQAELHASEIEALEQKLQAQEAEISKAKAKAESESAARLEAQRQAQIQSKQSADAESAIRSRIEAEYAEAVSSAKAEAQRQAKLQASEIKALEQKLHAQEDEISKAKATAESESAARLEAQKTAEEQAKARAEIEEKLRAVTTELSRQKQQAATAVEPGASEIQEQAESPDEVIVIKDKSLRARFLRSTDWLSNNSIILIVAGLLFLAVLVIISKLHGARRISGAYAGDVPESSSYIGVKLSGSRKSKRAVKGSTDKRLTFAAEQDPQQKTSEQPAEHWMKDWKERHASKVSNRDKPPRIGKKWPQEKDKA